MRRGFVRLTVNAENREGLVSYLSTIKDMINEGCPDGIGGGCKWWIDDIKEKENGKEKS